MSIKMWFSQISLFFAFLFSFAIPVKTADIVFWSDGNAKVYSKSFTEINLKKNCERVPQLEFKVRSITTDTCVLFYETTNCSGIVGRMIINTTKTWSDAQSCCSCSEKHLGFNIKIYNNSNIGETVVAKFENICNCVNIPNGLSTENLYFDSEGQHVLAYENERCTGNYSSSYGGNLWRKRAFQIVDRPLGCPL